MIEKHIIDLIYRECENKGFDPVTTECIDSLKEEIVRLMCNRFGASARIQLEYKNNIGELEKEIAEYDRKITENIGILERIHHAKHI
jgi:hypothetical protein